MKNGKFTMCVCYRDDGICKKYFFDLKSSALDWFETFQQENTRPVTVTFYCGVASFWVFRKD